MKLHSLMMIVAGNVFMATPGHQKYAPDSFQQQGLSCDLIEPPKFLSDGEPQDTIVYLDQSNNTEVNLVLKCLASGCPDPQYQWFRDHIDITKQAVNMKMGEFGFKVKKDDGVSAAGVKYYCTATNYINLKASIRSREATVTYAYTLLDSLPLVVVDVQVLIGGSLYLKCSMENANPPLQVISWMDGHNRQILNDWHIYPTKERAIYDNGGKYLFIKDITQPLIGRNNFRCRVSNASGPVFYTKVSYRLNADIRFRELVEYEREESFFGLPGQKISFRYVAHFRAETSYQGVGVTLNCTHPNIKFSRSNESITFTVPDATANNYSTSFTCDRVTLDASQLPPITYPLTILRPAQITVARPPEALLFQEDVGGSISLTCMGSGLPPPTLRWYHNGHPIPAHKKNVDVSGGYLKVSHITLHDFGIYQCSVSNINHGKLHVAHRMWFLMIIKKSDPDIELKVKVVLVFFLFITPSLTWLMLLLTFCCCRCAMRCCTCVIRCCRIKQKQGDFRKEETDIVQSSYETDDSEYYDETAGSSGRTSSNAQSVYSSRTYSTS